MEKTENFNGKVRHPGSLHPQTEAAESLSRCHIGGILTHCVLLNLQGYIIQKRDKKPNVNPGAASEDLLTYVHYNNKVTLCHYCENKDLFHQRDSYNLK